MALRWPVSSDPAGFCLSRICIVSPSTSRYVTLGVVPSVPGGLSLATLERAVTVIAGIRFLGYRRYLFHIGDCLSLPVFIPLLHRGIAAYSRDVSAHVARVSSAFRAPSTSQSIDLGRASLGRLLPSLNHKDKPRLTHAGVHLSTGTGLCNCYSPFLTFDCTLSCFELTFCFEKVI